MSDILENLNSQQQKAVEIIDRPVKIIAGAGSGKTRVLTRKIAYLIKEKNILPYKILAVTFTNKASKEMKIRVSNLLDLDDWIGNKPFISTFHSFCARVLREDYQAIGLKKTFSIIDTGDKKTIIRHLFKEEKTLVDKYSSGDINEFVKKATIKISGWKNNLTSYDDLVESADWKHKKDSEDFILMYKLYTEHLKVQGLVDYDDLQFLVHEIFENNVDICDKWRNRFDYILVDEFQDTNKAQFNLILFLTKGRNCLTVVGDPDQTIYSWRGADNKIILSDFDYYFSDYVKIILKNNYRSTQYILNLANSFISNNENREQKNLFSEKYKLDLTIKPQLIESTTWHAQGKFVAEEIKKLVKEKGYKYNDFFILYRSNFVSREFENSLTNAKIPFELIGGIKFRERRVIKDSMTLLQAIAKKSDFWMNKVLELIPGIGPVTINRINILSQEKSLSLFDLIIDSENEENIVKNNKHLNMFKNALFKASKLFEDNIKVEEIMEFLLKETGYRERLQNVSEENEENLTELLQQLHNFDSEFSSEDYGESNRTLAFLSEEALISSDDKEFEPNKVKLLTIHSAKGLENKVIFVVSLNKNIFPSKLSFRKEALEEERRTLYVAITRAEERLYLTYVLGDYSTMTKDYSLPSSFIRELNSDYYDFEKNVFVHSDGIISSNKVDNKSLESPGFKLNFKEGDLIHHNIMGDGVIVKIYSNEYKIAFKDPKFGFRTIPINPYILHKK